MHFDEAYNDFCVGAQPMLCDTSLGEDIPHPLPQGHFSWCICGKPGSGKSSYLISLLTAKKPNRAYRKVFHSIYFCIHPNSRASVKNSIFKEHAAEKMFDTLDVRTLEHIKGLCEADAMEDFNSLLVIDDQTAFLKDKGVEKLLRYLIFNRRHLRLSIFILVQSYTQIPLAIRKSFSHFTTFKPSNKKEIQSICEELVFLDKNLQQPLIDHCFQHPHDTLMGDATTGKFYHGFNEILIPTQ